MASYIYPCFNCKGVIIKIYGCGQTHIIGCAIQIQGVTAKLNRAGYPGGGVCKCAIDTACIRAAIGQRGAGAFIAFVVSQ